MRAGKEYAIKQAKSQTDYTDRNENIIPFYHEGGKTATAGIFTKRIGNTVYRVGVHYSSTSKETMGDKITRLVKNDISEVANNQ